MRKAIAIIMALVLLTLGLIPATPVAADSAVIQHGDHYYQFISGPATWLNARDAAASMTYSAGGVTYFGYLAIMNSQDENDWVYASVVPTGGRGWLGGFQLDNQLTTTAGWFWTTGASVDSGYKKWDTVAHAHDSTVDSPNDAVAPNPADLWTVGIEDNGENFMEMRGGGYWDDLGGYVTEGYIVEFEPEGLIKNGSFERPHMFYSGYHRFLTSQPGLGWQVYDASGLGVEYQNFEAAADGVQYAELDSEWSTGNVAIWQDVPTQAGQVYQLKFSWSPRPDYIDSNQIEVYWNEVKIYTTPIIADTGAMNWQPGNFLVLATGATTELKFKQIGTGDGEGTYLDNVSLVAVATPNPSNIVITGPVDPVAKGTPVGFTATFDDSPLVTDTAAWNWGDGSTSTTGTVDQTNDTVSGAHPYTSAGIYNVSLTLTNSVGGTGTRYYSFLVVVYDLEGGTGFVTGGGWIDSPAGADKVNTTATGKANFGFVSKYQKGANIPSGNTEFQFKEGDLNFKSTSYEWLVVAGARAQFKGVGTINGVGSYGFMLTAVDAEAFNNNIIPGDAFRIKIWYIDSDATRYDNGVDSLLGGGSIVIHN